MKRVRRITQTALGAFWYLAVVVLLPIVVLMGLGLRYLWLQNDLLSLLFWWLAVAVVSYALLLGWRFAKQRRFSDTQSKPPESSPIQLQDGSLPENLGERKDWSAEDIEIWRQLCKQIEAQLQTPVRWQTMQDLALATLAQTANAYHSGTHATAWRFTLPEALLILEETSRRYRTLVDDYLPFAEKITVASLMSLYDRQDQIARGLTWANRVRRLVRVVNPVGAVLGELRDLVTDRVFSELSEQVQQNLQRLLLQEVAQVAIDLYSGRLTVGVQELAGYQSAASRAAEQQQAMPAEPLRVLIFGQVSAGKSSLVNALLQQTVAEADVLPVTDRTTVHAVQLQDMSPLHLVDTPGYGVVEPNQDAFIETLLTADIWVLVTQLNRPARQADVQLLRRLDEALKLHPTRRVPPLLVVLSHVDLRLRAQSSGTASMEQIRESALGQLELPLETPLVACDLTHPGGALGIDEVINVLQNFESEAVQVQFNRRRLELGQVKLGWRNRLSQAGRLGAAVGGQIRDKLGAGSRAKDNDSNPRQ